MKWATQKLKVMLGFGLIIFGLASTLLPVIPGVPIMLAGCALIGRDHPLVRGLKERIQGWRERRPGERG